MIIRTKGASFKVDNTWSLLDYLGVKRNVTGIQKVTQDVELVACVPFCFAAETKTENELPLITNGINWTLSTFDLDRFGERIDPYGWELKQYQANPIIEWAHLFYIPAIGKMENLRVDNDGLHGSVVFNDKEYDQFGWSIGERVKAKVIRAGSVGFRVLEIEIPDRKTAEDGTSLIFRKQELLEFSICNVPANPYALAKAINNEKFVDKNDEVNNAFPFWGSFINNL